MPISLSSSSTDCELRRGRPSGRRTEGSSSGNFQLKANDDAAAKMDAPSSFLATHLRHKGEVCTKTNGQ